MIFNESSFTILLLLENPYIEVRLYSKRLVCNYNAVQQGWLGSNYLTLYVNNL